MKYPKFKIGQKVILTRAMSVKGELRNIWVPEFNRKVGKVFTIKSIRKDTFYNDTLVTFEEDSIPWSYNIKWIKAVTKKSKPVKKTGELISNINQYGV